MKKHKTVPANRSSQQIVAEFQNKIKPLLHDTKTKGEIFKAQKDLLFEQFKNHNIPFTHKSYTALRELTAKKRTVTSVANEFNTPKKQIQELAKILTEQEPIVVDLQRAYQDAYYRLISEADKRKDIYDKLDPNNKELNKVYNALMEELIRIDDDYRAGLKI